MKLHKGDILIFTNGEGNDYHWEYVGDGVNGHIKLIGGECEPVDAEQIGDIDTKSYPTIEDIIRDIKEGGFRISKETKIAKLLSKLDEAGL